MNMTPDQSKQLIAPLEQFVSGLVEISPEEWDAFKENLQVKKLNKGDRLFEQGEESYIVGFVVKGLIHTYFSNADGRTRTKNFAWEGRLISPWTAILNKQVANFTAEALEATQLVYIDVRQLSDIQRRHPFWESLSRRCTESVLAEREKREYENLMLSNLERYQSFKVQYQDILERIPQYLIASYLGMTSVALSRLLAGHEETDN